jgi:PadR family transcriptional regulator PadR
MTNSGEYIRGFTDFIVLSILSKFDTYGYEISKIIESVSDQSFQVTEAALYFALKRLMEDNKISSYRENNKKGMSRRYYRITPDGEKVLREFRKDWVQIENTLSSLVGGKFEYSRDDR